jgi:hypothetical protein
MQFKVDFTNPCDLATYLNPVLSDIHLSLLGPLLTFSFNPFTDSVSDRLAITEACGLWTYTITSPRLDEANYSLTQTGTRTWTL